MSCVACNTIIAQVCTYVSEDIAATIYPSWLCLVPARRPSISGKCAKRQRHSIDSFQQPHSVERELDVREMPELLAGDHDGRGGAHQSDLAGDRRRGVRDDRP